MNENSLRDVYTENKTIYALVKFDVSEVPEDVFKDITQQRMNDLSEKLLNVINSTGYDVLATDGHFEKSPKESRIKFYFACVYFKADSIKDYLGLEIFLQNQGYKIESSRIGKILDDK